MLLYNLVNNKKMTKKKFKTTYNMNKLWIRESMFYVYICWVKEGEGTCCSKKKKSTCQKLIQPEVKDNDRCNNLEHLHAHTSMLEQTK